MQKINIKLILNITANFFAEIRSKSPLTCDRNSDPRGQFFTAREGANLRIGANFVPRRQLERKCHCCVGTNSRELASKKLASENRTCNN
jgi:hypothetical protein